VQDVVAAHETAINPMPPASTATGAAHIVPSNCSAFPAESVATQKAAVTQETDAKFQTSGSTMTGVVQPVPSNEETVPA